MNLEDMIMAAIAALEEAEPKCSCKRCSDIATRFFVTVDDMIFVFDVDYK